MSTTVLVAEDEALIAMDVMDELDSAGFVAVGPFARNADALEYCRLSKPDCAVLDVCLADGASYAIADWLVAHDVPLVFHSAHAGTTELQARYPHMRLCQKPAQSWALSATVAELCGDPAEPHSPA